MYPKWLRRTFGDSDQVLTYLQVAEGRVKPGKPTVPFDWTVRSVCGKCNGGWMSRLETAVEPLLAPILNGERVTLSEQETRTLATWVFKTVLMIHEQGRTDRPLIPHRHYAHLFHQRTPPSGVRIWVAELHQPLGAAVVASRAAAERMEFTGIGVAPTPVGTQFYGTSMSLGPFMVCVLGNLDNDYTPVIVGDLANRMPELWPPPLSLSWPLPVNVEPYGGFPGVHRLLFEQPLAPFPPVASPWGNPDAHQP